MSNVYDIRIHRRNLILAGLFDEVQELCNPFTRVRTKEERDVRRRKKHNQYILRKYRGGHNAASN
jgi:hypothetical protein